MVKINGVIRAIFEFLSRTSKICIFISFFSAFNGAAILGAKRVNLMVQDRTSKIALMTLFKYPLGTQNNLELNI